MKRKLNLLYFSPTDGTKKIVKEIAKGMIYQLGTHYTAKNDPENEGLLLHGVYAHAEGKGVDEPNLWGDYFYLEALMRLAKPEWNTYW